jgi:hypothetical protein
MLPHRCLYVTLENLFAWLGRHQAFLFTPPISVIVGLVSTSTSLLPQVGLWKMAKSIHCMVVHACGGGCNRHHIFLKFPLLPLLSSSISSVSWALVSPAHAPAISLLKNGTSSYLPGVHARLSSSLNANRDLVQVNCATVAGFSSLFELLCSCRRFLSDFTFYAMFHSP